MELILVLVLSTLCLRLVTAQSMRKQAEQRRRAEGEFEQMSAELRAIAIAVEQVERQQRQCALRRARLLGRIDAARAELERLRRPASGRLAA